MPKRPGVCPACERFIGPLDVCPFCDCPSERQAGLLFLRLLAILLAVGGLALLALAVRQREPPAITVASIRPSMNFARVLVSGSVVTAPRSGRTRSGETWYGLTVEDGTGRIRLSAFGETADTLLARWPSPALSTGTPVRAEGWLTVRAGQMPSLQLRDPDHLRPGEAP